MLDHISLRVQDYQRAVAFFKAALAPLGYELCMEFPGYAGLGANQKPDLWLTQTDKALNPTHLAFSTDRAGVDAFHAAALAAGGTDHGPPGLRLDYHPNYYAAYVLDPEGNNIEVVCHVPPGAPKVAKAAKARKPAKASATAKRSAKPAAKKAKAPKGKAKAAKGKKKRR
jgi:catechol 2,3-dioxygenase-like lactoylglutathione lyase family enzyme